jgi:outer membrane protein OmpA-like peptidoglycan-associated protein
MMNTQPLKISLVVAQLFLISESAFAQTPPEPTAPLAYAGGNTRVGGGYDSRDKLRGEISHVFADDEKSAWLGEAWVGDGAGGLQLDYHWRGDEDERVSKVFVAWDRNQWNDQKLTVGTGAEYPSWFWGAYLSAGLARRRDTGSTSTSITETRSGTDANGPYLQDFTTTTTIRSFEQAYDHGVGGRLGHFYEDALLRLTVGADHEWGAASSRQTTVSLGLEKFFAGSPHSILVAAAASNRSGDFETRRNDRRIGIYWRYEFGGPHGSSWQAAKTYRRVDDPPTAVKASTVAEPAAGVQKNVVKVTEMVDAETFFDFDRSVLRIEAHKILNDLATRIKGASLQGPLQIVGHTCNLGPAAYNQRLSERRAAAVRDYLIAQGALPAERVVATGMGEDSPKYPNTRAERPKNRRCDIEFTVVTDQLKELPAATVAAATTEPVPPTPSWHYVEESVASPWAERALRNPVVHKREVDPYRTMETSVTTSEGARVYLPPPVVPVVTPTVNHAPVAVNDLYDVYGTQLPAILNVLANDYDPDHDPIHVTSVTQGSNGMISVLADGRVSYMWRSIHVGVEQFSYTIADSHGATSSAIVTLNIIDP